MTFADWLRSRTDMELAVFLSTLLSERDRAMSKKLDELGIPNSIIEMPELSVLTHLKYLQQPMEE